MPKDGSTSERGYGHQHRVIREAMRPYVEAGRVICWRCERRIKPGQAWDVGHDRGVVRGPEHARCNRQAGARARHGKREPEAHPNTRARR